MTHFIKYVVSVSTLSLAVVRIREPLGSGEKAIGTMKEVKDERAPQEVTPERYVGTVLQWCGL